MKKKPPVCPSCGTIFEVEAAAKTRRPRPPVEDKEPKKKIVTEDDLDEIEIDTGDADEEALIEDADELGEDNLDVEDVIELDDEKDDL
jgi:hypothetical protein